MLTQFKAKPFYFIIMIALLCVNLIVGLFFSKASSFQYLNQYHNNWLDNFFINFTFLGDGLISVFTVLFLLLLRKNKEAGVLLAAFLSSGLLSGLFKNLFSLPRPKLYFEQSHLLYNNFIDGITLSNNSSFPSGHTASAFAMATVIVLLSDRKYVPFISIIAAVLVGYSRIYLGQHFLPDIAAGAFLGIACAMASYFFIYQKQVKLFGRFRRNKYSIPQEISTQWN